MVEFISFIAGLIIGGGAVALYARMQEGRQARWFKQVCSRTSAEIVTLGWRFQTLREICPEAEICQTFDGQRWYVRLPKMEIGGDGHAWCATSFADSPAEAVEHVWEKFIALPEGWYIAVKDKTTGERMRYRWEDEKWVETI